MVDVNTIRALAYIVAVITYLLGTIFLAAPGHRGMKEAGREMVEDGILAIVLITLTAGLPALIFWVSSILFPNVSLTQAYNAFFKWANEQKMLALGMAAVMMAITFGLGAADQALNMLLPGSAPFSALAKLFLSFISLWVGAIYGTYTLLSVIEKLGAILLSSWDIFVAYGSLIYALPKRIGRGLGGAMISGALVYLIGIPLMPSFCNLVGMEVSTEFASLPADVSKMTPLMVIDLATGLSPAATLFIWKYAVLPVFYLSLLGFISSGVSRLLQSFTPWVVSRTRPVS
jgi:hypothetical protein